MVFDKTFQTLASLQLTNKYFLVIKIQKRDKLKINISMCYKELYYLLEIFKISLTNPSLYIHKFLIIIHTETTIQQQLMKT